VVKYWRRRRLHEREDVIRDELQGREGNEDGDEPMRCRIERGSSLPAPRSMGEEERTDIGDRWEGWQWVPETRVFDWFYPIRR